MSIHRVAVHYADRSKTTPRRVRVVFGNGHQLEIRTDQDGPTVTLATPEQSIRLTTAGQHSPFRRAVNLLRLHTPTATR